MQDGRYSHGRLLMIKYLQNGLPHNRYCVVAGKKVAKSAVKRNRVKRIIREAARLKEPEMRQGYDFMIVAKPAIAAEGKIAESPSVRAELDALLSRSRLIAP